MGYRVYNYKKISDLSKVLILIYLVSLYAFPFLTMTNNIMGQSFNYELSNTGITQSTSGLFTGNGGLSEKIPYISYLEMCRNKDEGKILNVYKIIIYIYSHVIAFPNAWLLLSVVLIASMFVKDKKYVAVPAVLSIIYYLLLVYTIYGSVKYLGYQANLADLFTGIPITNSEARGILSASETYILKLGYGWYVSIISNVLLLHENLQ